MRYAIADVAAFVRPGGALDQAARQRGVTIYLPDEKAPLHPAVLSEGAASLLPGEERRALVWRIVVDDAGEATEFSLRRALVRSRRAYTYQEVQAALDAGPSAHADPQFVLLRELGLAREARQAARGGLDLRLPEQSVVESAGAYQLVYRAPVPVEGWNAQVSLLAGECAAALMLDAGVGVVRTLPPPGDGVVARLRRHAKALGVPWPPALGYAEFVRSLDPRVPDHAALMVQSASLARGASYEAFTSRPAEAPVHSAVGAPYAHVTAPLRRLVDRFANEVVVSVCAGAPVPAWVLSSLESLPELMRVARARERAASRMAVDLAEASVLAGCAGGRLDGVVVDVRDGDATVQIRRPAVVAVVPGAARDGAVGLGDEVALRVGRADVAARTVELTLV